MAEARAGGDDDGAIVVFDGACVLCSGWVDFLLRRDRRGQFRFAAMQGEAGRGLLAAHGLDPDDPLSFLLLDAGGARTDSDAILAVLARLGGGWRFAALLRWLPRGLRDALYRALARNRYRWFGRRDACYLPSADEVHRFL
jgi:predicted DCC family thiol-disulfide oxidoreductase YuxK